MNELSVKIEVEVKPTEDIQSVRQAVENIFGILSMEEKTQHRDTFLLALTSSTESLTKFSNLLRRERIRDAARAVLFQGLKDSTITFYLNKQVASTGHVSFCEPTTESSLGPIKIQIKSSAPRKLIEWLAPRTP